MAAQLNGDVDALARLLADDLIYTGFAGEIGRKNDDLALHCSGRFRIMRMEMMEREVRDFGDTVAVVVLMDTAATFDQVLMHKVLRYTRIWAHRDGVWRLAVAHIGEVVGESRRERIIEPQTSD